MLVSLRRRGTDWLPLLFLVAVALLFPVSRSAYVWTVAEDGPFEWLTALVYVTAAIVAMRVAIRLRGSGKFLAPCYAVLVVGFVFIAGEEVSWGQRILGFAGPEPLVNANIQDESNLHNLLSRYWLHGAYILVGLWGSGVGRWVTSRVAWLHPSTLFAPGRELMWWFVPVAGYYLYIDYLGAPLLAVTGAQEGTLIEMIANGPSRFQEAVELVLAGGFLLFVLGSMRWARGDHAQEADAPGRTGEPPSSSAARRQPVAED